jgi:hypothetical protein
MKKLFILFLFLAGVVLQASAQVERKANQKKVKVERRHSETKVKRTSSPRQKVHNLVHRRRRHYSGVRVKHKNE